MPVLNSLYFFQLDLHDIKQGNCKDNEYPPIDSFKLILRTNLEEGGMNNIFNTDLVINTDYSADYETLPKLSKCILQFLKQKDEHFSFELGENFIIEIRHSRKKGYYDFIVWYNGCVWESFHENLDNIAVKLVVAPRALEIFAHELYDEWKQRKVIEI